jgi:hypothetical protein
MILNDLLAIIGEEGKGDVDKIVAAAEGGGEKVGMATQKEIQQSTSDKQQVAHKPKQRKRSAFNKR